MRIETKMFCGTDWISNCYIVYRNKISNECLIIDPGSSDITAYVEFIRKHHLIPKYLFITHRHYDHFAGANELRKMYPKVKLVCSVDCNYAIQNARLNCSIFMGNHKAIVLKAADITFDDVFSFVWNNYTIDCVPTPGHTEDSTSILIEDNVFTGDALLKDVPTVTKLPSGNKEQQKETEDFLLSLHGYKAWPGHGEAFEIK